MSCSIGTEGNGLRRFDVDTIGNPKQLDDVLIEAASDGETGGPGPDHARRPRHQRHDLPLPGRQRPLRRRRGHRPDRDPPGLGRLRRERGTRSASWSRPTSRTRTTTAPASPSAAPSTPRAASSRPWSASRRSARTPVSWCSGSRPTTSSPARPARYPNGEISTGKFCKIDVTIGSASAVLIDAQDNIYVASPASFQVLKFCAAVPDRARRGGRLRPPRPDRPAARRREQRRTARLFIQGAFLETFTGLAKAKNGNLYVGQVLAGGIEEYDFGSNPCARPVRTIV